MKTVTRKVGVVIARFQTPKLHAAHRALLDTVLAQHPKTLVLLGTSPVKNTSRNPLDYATREAMVKAAYPGVLVLPLSDVPSDEVWSKRIDTAVYETFGGEVDAVLYGSRDSALPSYKGGHEKKELPSSHKVSATDLREIAMSAIGKTEQFRAGVIYAAGARFATSYQCVDIVPIRQDQKGVTYEVLLGRKRTDKQGLWRTVGGFVSPTDPSLEFAALRELGEEAGENLSCHQPRYVGSARIPDWRYRNEKDKILTSVFVAVVMYGAAKAGDDLDEVRWFDPAEVHTGILVPEHHEVWEKIQLYLTQEAALAGSQ